MQKEDLLAVPSPGKPYPEPDEKYFAAKESPITANEYIDRIDVIQNEVHGDTRLNRAARIAYAEKLARAIISFYKVHYGRYHKIYILNKPTTAVTLCMLGNIQCFCCCMLTFSKLIFSTNSLRSTIRVSNVLDADQKPFIFLHTD